MTTEAQRRRGLEEETDYRGAAEAQRFRGLEEEVETACSRRERRGRRGRRRNIRSRNGFFPQGPDFFFSSASSATSA
jgi:hypothetical protein